MKIDDELIVRSRTIPKGGFRKRFWLYVERVTGRPSLGRFLSQSAALSMLGGLPTMWSSLARGIIYRKLMGNMDRNCIIEKKVRFLIPKRIFLGNRVFIGENSRLDPERIESEIRIDDDVYIGHGCILRAGRRVSPPGRIHLHEGVYVGDRSFLYGAGEIEVGKFSTLAHNVSLISSDHGLRDLSIPMAFQMPEHGRIEIGENVWLGAKVVVTSGVKINDGSIVMPGSVVTKEVPPYTLVAGIPARVLKNESQL